jgi:hypothetical protein
MSKTKKTFRNDWDDEDNNYNSFARDADRRKEKHLKNAIRSKNIKSLLEMEDDEDYD